MTPDIHSVPARPAPRFELIKGGRIAVAAITMAALFLTGCAQLPPLVEQLKTEKKTQITLLVEDGPFQYSSPATVDAAGGGLPIIALLGAVVAIASQNGLDGANTRLASAASGKAGAADHRKAFVGLLVRRLDQLGITADVVSVPYEPTSLGKDRRLYRPMVEQLPPRNDEPLFALNFDAGTCSFGSVAPCMRYFLREVPSTHKAAPRPPGSSDTFRNAGASSSPSLPRYRGVFGTSPDRSKPYAAELKTFASVDEAVLNVSEFDRELSKIVPFAVDELVSWLESTPARASGTTSNPPATR